MKDKWIKTIDKQPTSSDPVIACWPGEEANEYCVARFDNGAWIDAVTYDDLRAPGYWLPLEAPEES